MSFVRAFDSPIFVEEEDQVVQSIMKIKANIDKVDVSQHDRGRTNNEMELAMQSMAWRWF